ncbi:hypothetical protein ACLMJK_000473 [Lecanora helva]
MQGSRTFPKRAATKEQTPIGEGESYLRLAHHFLSSPSPSNPYTHLPTTHLTHDPHATDSYQNLLFSLLHFRTLTHTYPSHITIISHAFKRRRFLELHLPGIRWPRDRVTYVGIDPPECVTSKSSLEEGEERRGYGVWKGDLYGVGEVLGGKRVGRGWREECLGGLGEGVEEGVRGLLGWRGGESGVEVYGGDLPWAVE